MPDAGDIERGRHPHQPQSWAEAFSALPLQGPEPGGWQRVQARLRAPPARRRRAHRTLWLAIAASLLLALAIPLRIAPPGVPTVGGGPAADAPARAVAAAQARAATPAPVAATPTPAVYTAVAVAAVPARVRSEPPPARRVRAEDSHAASPPAKAQTATDAALESLYARSAQLESLLALARDERVSSGTTAALSDELDARVAGIDAALIQSGLGDAERAELWHQRVDALQQLVGIEATNRLYAARGQSYDAALVSID